MTTYRVNLIIFSGEKIELREITYTTEIPLLTQPFWMSMKQILEHQYKKKDAPKDCVIGILSVAEEK